MHNKRGPVLERTYKSQSVIQHMPGGSFGGGYGSPSNFYHSPSMIEERMTVNEYDVDWFVR
jgi:hypothetical protein